MSHLEIAWLKKAVHLHVENTKIGAYATSDLKSDNKGEPQKNTISIVFSNIWIPRY